MLSEEVQVNGLLPSFISEVARVLRPKGRLVLLLTRAHGRQVLQLLGEAAWKLRNQGLQRQMTPRKVFSDRHFVFIAS